MQVKNVPDAADRAASNNFYIGSHTILLPPFFLDLTIQRTKISCQLYVSDSEVCSPYLSSCSPPIIAVIYSQLY
jgi:hypothetical protein